MGKEAELPKNIRQIGDVRDREKICVEDYVMTYIRKKEPEEEQGYLGIFLGEKKETEESEYIFIRGILEIEKSEDEKEGSILENLEKAKKLYFPEWEIQGSCVIGTYPAARMEALIQVLPEAGNLLYHLQEQEENFYRMKNGQYQRIKGYFVFYEQNKLMQEYMAEIFGDKRVEGEALSDQAIRNFREKVSQKGEKRNRSMLKLAASFFVITVLAAGTVAVNRMEKMKSISEMLLEANHTGPDVSVFANQTEPVVLDEDNGAKPDVPASVNQAEENTVVSDIGSQPEEEQDLEQEIEKESVQGTEKEAEQEWKVSGVPQMTQELIGAETFWEDEYEETEAETAAETAAEVNSVRQIQAAYVIRQGDTLADICNQYYGNLEYLEEICVINEIEDANKIMPGQKIVLP